MADSKITALTALTAADPTVDMFPVVDVSDTTMAASGTTKRISINNILACSPSATLASATITGNLTVDTNTLFVDSANDNVGIGTTSPQVYSGYRTLGIVGKATGSVIDINPSGGVTAGGLQIGCTAAATNIDAFGPSAGTAAPLVLRTGTFGSVSERYRVAGDGVATWSNVGGGSGTAMTLNSTGLGVGVTPTASKLQIGLSAVAAVPAAGATGHNFAFGSTQYGLAGGALTSGNSYIQATRWDGTATNYDLLIQPNGGNVGIGVAPSYKLHVAGTGYFSSTLTLDGATRLAGAGSNSLNFNTNSVDRVTIDGSGNTIVTTTATAPSLGTARQMVFNLTSDTNLRISVRGTDGTTRTANITLA